MHSESGQYKIRMRDPTYPAQVLNKSEEQELLGPALMFWPSGQEAGLCFAAINFIFSGIPQPPLRIV